MTTSRFTIHAIYITFLFSFAICTHAQVGIGTTSPSASSVLDITSTTQGMLTPRMTTAQRTAIATPANGLLVYDTDENAFYFYDNSIWNKLESEIRNNYKLVKSQADLPAPSGGVITLDTNTFYEINGTIVLTNSIDLNGAYLVGLDTNEDILVRAGGVIFSGDKGGSVRNLTLTAPGGTVFNLDDTANNQMLVLQNCIVANSASVGTIKGCNIVFSNIIQYSGNTAGITYDNINDLLLNNQGWLANNSGTYETFTGTFNLLQKVSGFSMVNAGNTGIDVSSNPTVASGIILGTVFTGTATNYINKYTTATAPFSFTNQWIVSCEGVPVESDVVSAGYYHMVNNTTVTPLTTNNTPVKIVGTTSADNLFRVTSPADNRLTYVGQKAREFEIICTGTLNHTVNNGRRYEFYVYKNGVQVPEISAERRFSRNDVGNFTLIGVTTLNPNDYIEVWVSINNVNSVPDCLVERLSVVLK